MNAQPLVGARTLGAGSRSVGLGAGGLPTRPRRWGQWASAVLFVLGSVIGAGWLWQHQGDRVEVLVVGSAVPEGHVIGSDDLTSAGVSGVPGAIGVAEVGRVVGATAGVPLLPGQVLTEAMVTGEPVPAADQRVVGVELDATRTPGSLAAGDVVSVLAVPVSGDASDPSTLRRPVVLAEAARVHSVDWVEGGGTRLALVVAEDQAHRVASFGAVGRVALVQAPVGAGR